MIFSIRSLFVTKNCHIRQWEGVISAVCCGIKQMSSLAAAVAAIWCQAAQELALFDVTDLHCISLIQGCVWFRGLVIDKNWKVKKIVVKWVVHIGRAILIQTTNLYSQNGSKFTSAAVHDGDRSACSCSLPRAPPSCASWARRRPCSSSRSQEIWGAIQ